MALKYYFVQNLERKPFQLQGTFSNSLCKPGTKIVEIAPAFKEKYEFNLSKRYEILSKINGLEHSIINADTVKTKKHSVLAKKYINKKVLEESSYYSDLIVRINNFNNF